MGSRPQKSPKIPNKNFALNRDLLYFFNWCGIYRGAKSQNFPESKKRMFAFYDIAKECVLNVLELVYSTIQYNTIQYNTMQCKTMKCKTIKCKTIKCKTIRCKTTQCRTIQCNTTQCRTIQCNTIQCHHHPENDK